MLPGDVYYYSTNSFVLCVKQNCREQSEETQPKVNRRILDYC